MRRFTKPYRIKGLDSVSGLSDLSSRVFCLLCHYQYDVHPCRRLCCAFLTTLLRTAAIQRPLRASCYYLAWRGRSLCPSQFSGAKATSRLSRIIILAFYEVILSLPLQIYLLRRVFFKAFSPRTPYLEEFYAGLKYRSTFNRRPFSRI